MRGFVKAVRMHGSPGEWVSGNLVVLSAGTKHFIIPPGSEETDIYSMAYEVDPETICYNTGHPNNIFEGDEVSQGKVVCRVVWHPARLGYLLENIETGYSIGLFQANHEWEPTGKNIHDKETGQ